MTAYIAGFVLPLLLVCLAVLLLAKRKSAPHLFDEFLSGARDGITTSVRLLPTLVALMVAVAMVRESGLGQRLADLLAPCFAPLGIPAELLPLALIRPFSGSGSNAMLTDLFAQYGADSFVGIAASVLVGSSDTLVYIIAVYFSAVGVRRTRHALPAATLTALACLILSCFVCRLFFPEGLAC